jgi:hypothetical protein
MATLTQASTQWATRPDDQRFTSLDDLLAFTSAQRRDSRSLAVSSRRIEARPIAVDEGKFARELVVMGPDGAATSPTHWAFGQLAAMPIAERVYFAHEPAAHVVARDERLRLERIRQDSLRAFDRRRWR